ncbi:hypothetical protein DE146DRAFT_109705 [Phaeosphaeria sp. MPI-PUGE-AT-0046c]|nr:hypothetical protein DE146DRAFT_109705 [Phaeosphaeria sp. MPI-PUGE-AT-0046c]
MLDDEVEVCAPCGHCLSVHMLYPRCLLRSRGGKDLLFSCVIYLQFRLTSGVIRVLDTDNEMGSCNNFLFPFSYVGRTTHHHTCSRTVISSTPFLWVSSLPLYLYLYLCHGAASVSVPLDAGVVVGSQKHLHHTLCLYLLQSTIPSHRIHQHPPAPNPTLTKYIPPIQTPRAPNAKLICRPPLHTPHATQLDMQTLTETRNHDRRLLGQSAPRGMC